MVITKLEIIFIDNNRFLIMCLTIMLTYKKSGYLPAKLGITLIHHEPNIAGSPSPSSYTTMSVRCLLDRHFYNL